MFWYCSALVSFSGAYTFKLRGLGWDANAHTYHDVVPPIQQAVQVVAGPTVELDTLEWERGEVLVQAGVVQLKDSMVAGEDSIPLRCVDGGDGWRCLYASS